MPTNEWQGDFEFAQGEVEAIARCILDNLADVRGPLIAAASAYVLEELTFRAVAAGHDRESANCNIGRILELGMQIRQDEESKT